MPRSLKYVLLIVAIIMVLTQPAAFAHDISSWVTAILTFVQHLRFGSGS